MASDESDGKPYDPDDDRDEQDDDASDEGQTAWPTKE